MSEDEILAMEAGRGIDALIAEKVMGWRMVNHADWPEGTLIRDYHHRIEWYAPGMKEEPGALGAGLESCMVPRYSTDIAAAPDLLAACEAVRETCPCDPDINPEWIDAWQSMLAAIARAKGES